LTETLPPNFFNFLLA